MDDHHVIHSSQNLGEAVVLTVGAASTCWEPMDGTGVFQSERALELSQELMHWITHHHDTILKPQRSKGEKIVADCIINDEPFFVFRGRDIFAPMVLKYYIKMLEDFGPDDPDFQTNIVNFINYLRKWQSEHVSEVRYPD